MSDHDGNSTTRIALTIAAVALTAAALWGAMGWGDREPTAPPSKSEASSPPQASVAPYEVLAGPVEWVSAKQYQINTKRYIAEFEARRDAGNLAALTDDELNALMPFVLSDALGTVFVDHQGTIQAALPYVYCLGFSEQVAAVATKVNDNRSITQFGYANREGKLVIAGKYQHALPFSEGMAGVKIDGKYGFIDKSGAIVIPPTFYLVDSFVDGIARVQPDPNTVDFIDPSGKVLLHSNAADVGAFSDGLLYANVAWDRKVLPQSDVDQASGSRIRGYMDTTFRFAFELGEASSGFWPLRCRGFHEGLAAIEGAVENESDKANAWSYISDQGVIAIPGPYKQAKDFSDGRAAVALGFGPGPVWGFIDSQGQMIISPKYLEADDFSEGMAAVLIAEDSPEANAQYRARWGYIDSEGRIAIKPQFYHAGPFRGGVALASIGPGNRGLINRAGQFVFQLNDPTNE